MKFADIWERGHERDGWSVYDGYEGEEPVPDALIKLEEALRSASHGSGEAGTLARDLLPLAEEARREADAVGGVTRPSKRSGAGITYVVEKTAAGEVLAEYRLSGKSKAFKCPKALYGAVAETLAAATAPLSLDEIMSAIERQTGERPADFQMRVPLRFWLHSNPALVTRNRARYRVSDSTNFLDACKSVWTWLQDKQRAEKRP